MKENELHVVTGGLGYSGRYIAQRLLSAGARVRTITNSPQRPHPFGNRLEIHPLSFDDPVALQRVPRGAAVLYNTYWVRFNHARFRHATAVENTPRLFEAARRAGVRRIVHVSITNPSLDSPLEYFRGKAVLEEALRDSGISHAILRPTVLFGREDILINNIAWLLRRFPVFGVFGDGRYRLQPIFVDDLAALAVAEGARSGNTVVNAIGPETLHLPRAGLDARQDHRQRTAPRFHTALPRPPRRQGHRRPRPRRAHHPGGDRGAHGGPAPSGRRPRGRHEAYGLGARARHGTGTALCERARPPQYRSASHRSVFPGPSGGVARRGGLRRV